MGQEMGGAMWRGYGHTDWSSKLSELNHQGPHY
jgi:hypothetical protein